MIGLTRVRNESLIIADTIRHFLQHCDHLILFDDCSDDDTPDIAESVAGDRITIVCGAEWRSERTAEETRHRGLLLEYAQAMGADWCLYFDADERLVGDLPELTGDGFRFRLFDGYLTPDRCQDYTGGDLASLPRMWGPEYRDILFLFRADSARYFGLDRREPAVSGKTALAATLVKHYGKCLSIDHWEATCDYYAAHFPEPYRSKWQARKGRALHNVSDFGRELHPWNNLIRNRPAWSRL